MASEISQAVRRLRKQGYDVTMNGSGHWSISRDGQLLTVIPATSKNRRVTVNLKTRLRQHERHRAVA